MMPSKFQLASTALLLAATLALTVACAVTRREAFLQDKARTHVYRQPLAEVWGKARELLEKEGYALMQAQGAFEMQTEWQMQGAPSSLGTTSARYLVRGAQRGSGQSTVEFLKQMRSESQPAHDTRTGGAAEGPGADYNQLTRDYAMEWKLLKRADPEAAKALEAEAARAVP